MPLPMVFGRPYPWHIEPHTDVILTRLPMVYRTPYPWDIEPPSHAIFISTHCILTPLSMVF
jgi:hypothetical protein